MATNAQIRAGFVAALNDIPGVQLEQTGAYQLANPTLPTIWVFPGETDYHGAMQNGLTTKSWVVQAFVGIVLDIAAQERLDEMLADTGDNSVKAALEGNLTLGGRVDDLTVTGNSGYRVFQLPAAPGPVLGADWTVEIFD